MLGLGADCAPEALIDAVREGLPYKAFERVQAFLDMPARQLGARLSISERTLARRRQRGRLTPEESDRLLRLARLAEMTLVVFEEQQANARRWLTAPKNLLGAATPMTNYAP